MTCNCKVCTDHRRWLAALNPSTDEAKAVFDELLSRLEASETDCTVWKLKYEGKWNRETAEDLTEALILAARNYQEMLVHGPVEAKEPAKIELDEAREKLLRNLP